jgi:hypothetical protein
MTANDTSNDYLFDSFGRYCPERFVVSRAEITTKTWAEVGEWTRGEPALVIMCGDIEDGQLVDTPEVLHDVPVAAWPDNLTPSAGDAVDELKALGYRKVPGAREDATEYGVAFDIEAW